MSHALTRRSPLLLDLVAGTQAVRAVTLTYAATVLVVQLRAPCYWRIPNICVINAALRRPACR